jgi:hypothetical protein
VNRNAPLLRKEIPPADLLGAARTIPKGRIELCNWLPNWIEASTYLDWARRGLEAGDGYGLSNAITYAKRAAASRIDALVCFNHLAPLYRPGVNYQARIQALIQLGISIPASVYELVFSPRNDIEQEYEMPTMEDALRAADTAELFVGATEAEYEKTSILAVAWEISGESPEFRPFREQPILFIDVFEEPHSAKVVHPKEGEVLMAALSRFTSAEALELARLLRSNYEDDSLTSVEWEPLFFQDMKELGGL